MAFLKRLGFGSFFSDLPDVYTKDEIDARYYTQTEVNNLIGSLERLRIEKVTSLPTEGEDNVMYIVPKQGVTPNIYDEYLWANGNWEKIGDTQVDLSNYYNITEINNLLNRYYQNTELYNKTEVNNLLDAYYTQSQVNNLLNEYYRKTETYNKTEVDNLFDAYYTKTEVDNKLKKTELRDEIQSFNILMPNGAYGGATLDLSPGVYMVCGSTRFGAGTSDGGSEYSCWIANANTPTNSFAGAQACYGRFTDSNILSANCIVTAETAGSVGVYSNIKNAQLGGNRCSIQAVKLGDL